MTFGWGRGRVCRARALDTDFPTPFPPSLEIGWKVPDHWHQTCRKQFCLMWQTVHKCVFTPCVYTQYTRNSTMDKNGHFLSQSKIIISPQSNNFQ